MMKLQELRITRRASYEKDSGQLKAMVKLENGDSTMELALSTSVVLAICRILEQETSRKALVHAKSVAGGFAEQEEELCNALDSAKVAALSFNGNLGDSDEL